MRKRPCDKLHIQQGLQWKWTTFLRGGVNAHGKMKFLCQVCWEYCLEVLSEVSVPQENVWAFAWLCDSLATNRERIHSFYQEISQEIQNSTGVRKYLPYTVCALGLICHSIVLIKEKFSKISSWQFSLHWVRIVHSETIYFITKQYTRGNSKHHWKFNNYTYTYIFLRWRLFTTLSPLHLSCSTLFTRELGPVSHIYFITCFSENGEQKQHNRLCSGKSSCSGVGGCSQWIQVNLWDLSRKLTCVMDRLHKTNILNSKLNLIAFPEWNLRFYHLRKIWRESLSLH